MMQTLASQPAPLTLEPLSNPPASSLTASLILVNYNGRADLVRCLDSIYDHLDLPDSPPDGQLEVVVVDNASRPGELDGLAQRYPGVAWIESSQNLGFAGGCNLGARQARGEALVFLNTDTIVTPGWLESLLAPLAADPRVGLVTAQVRLFSDPGRLNTAGNEIHISGLTLCRAANLPVEQAGRATQVSAVSGAAFAMRRALFEALGGFDSDYFMYMEDTDLSWRARLAGYRCWYAPDSVVYHNYRLRFRPAKTYYQERNRYQTLLKNLRWGSLLALLPVLLLAELVTWGYVLAFERRQWADKPRAYAWIVRHWGDLMRKRRLAQAQRAADDRQVLREHSTRLDFEQTGRGALPTTAHLLFDPLFLVFQRLALLLIRW